MTDGLQTGLDRLRKWGEHMRTATHHRVSFYHTAPQETTSDELRAQATALEQARNAADTLCYSRYTPAVAEAMRRRDIAHLRAQAEQLDLEEAEDDLQTFIDEGRRGLLKAQGDYTRMCQDAASRAWRAYETAEDALRAAELDEL